MKLAVYFHLQLMIIAKISDGFGNQLFMYACGYAAAKRLNTKLMLDTSYLNTSRLRNYELDKLNIKYDRCFTTAYMTFYPLKVLLRKTVHGLWRIKYFFYKEKEQYIYDKTFPKLQDNTYLFGYWQTEKYFKEYREDLLQLITPKYLLSEGCKHYINKAHECNSVAVHIRRGDYVKLGICLESSYYQKAFEYIEQKVENIRYFIFSDDLDYAKQIFTSDKQRTFEYVKYASDNLTLDDFFIMKECKHIIMANSSFSWWAAWLNDNPNKLVVYPKTASIHTDLYPKEWIMI